MRPLAKVGVVGGGYIGAVAFAAAVVTGYVAATNTRDRHTYGAMFAFGDSLLFLAVFSVAAVVPTTAGLFFLRPYRAFWRVLSVTAGVVATTAVAALVVHRLSHTVWGALAVLRILLGPLFGLTFFASAVMAPTRNGRFALLVATAIEFAVFVCVVSMILVRSR